MPLLLVAIHHLLAGTLSLCSLRVGIRSCIWKPVRYFGGLPTGNVLFRAKLLASCPLPYGRSEEPEPSQKSLCPRADLRYLEPSAQPRAADGEGLCSMLGGGGRQEH